MKLLHKLFFLYQKAFWYIAQFGNELSKPLRFWSEFALLILVLDKLAIRLTLFQMIAGYIIIMLLAILFGSILAKIGVVKYNTTLQNEHNEELKEILKLVKAIKNDKK